MADLERRWVALQALPSLKLAAKAALCVGGGYVLYRLGRAIVARMRWTPLPALRVASGTIERVFATSNTTYVHGGGMAQAPALLADSAYRALLAELTPVTADRLRAAGVGGLKPSAAMLIMENNPVLGAFYTRTALEQNVTSTAQMRSTYDVSAAPTGAPHNPVVLEWDVYMNTRHSNVLGSASLPGHTVVQHGTLMQILLERVLGWNMHSQVRQLSGDMNVPRWLALYFLSLKRGGTATTASGSKLHLQGAAAIAQEPAAARAPLLSVFLDVKSTGATAHSIAALVRQLNAAGVHVWAVGSFVYPQLAAVAGCQQSVACPVPALAPGSDPSAVCDDALRWLRGAFPAEELPPDVPELRSCAPSSSPTPLCAPSIDCPPPLSFYLCSSAAQVQRAAAAGALPRNACVVFNGGSLVRREISSELQRALYMPVRPQLEAARINAVLRACGRPARSWTLESASVSLFEFLFQDPEALSFVVPQLYDVEALAVMADLQQRRGFRFGWYTDEQKLEPAAASMLAALAEHRREMFPLGHNYGAIQGQCAEGTPGRMSADRTVPEALKEGGARRMVALHNGCMVPWWLRSVIPSKVVPLGTVSARP
jgi:hypothetical protein